jgi:hypothetical protein
MANFIQRASDSISGFMQNSPNSFKSNSILPVVSKATVISWLPSAFTLRNFPSI